MFSEQLISELKELSRREKYHLIQLLVAELLIEEENELSTGGVYEVFTPYGNESAASVLAEFLKRSMPEDD
jgi:hypothetical protein